MCSWRLLLTVKDAETEINTPYPFGLHEMIPLPTQIVRQNAEISTSSVMQFSMRKETAMGNKRDEPNATAEKIRKKAFNVLHSRRTVAEAVRCSSVSRATCDSLKA